MANIRLRNQYAPSVREQFVPQPTIPSDIGDTYFSALKGLGSSIQSFAANLAAAQSKASDFFAQKAYIDTATQDQALLNQQMNDAPLGAAGFTQQTLDFFQQRHDKILGDLSGKLPPEQLQNLSLRLAELRRQIVAKALTFQDQSWGAKVQADFGETAGNLANIVSQDPPEVTGALEELRKTVASIPNLDAPTKQGMYEAQAKVIRLAAGLGEARDHPQETVDALSGGEASSGSLGIQLGFVAHELTTSESSAGTALKNAQTVTAATEAAIGYERPKGWSSANPQKGAGWSRRLSNANRLFKGDGLSADETFAMNFYMQQGLTRAQAAGLVGNLIVESGLNPGAKGDGGKAFGIGQWHGDRQTVLQEFAKNSGSAVAPGQTGNNILDLLTVDERSSVLSAAQTRLNQLGADVKAQLSHDEANATAALLRGEDYRGTMPTEARYLQAFGQVKGPQKWAAFQGVVREGRFIKQMTTLPEAQINAKLADLAPDPNKPDTYAVDAEAFQSVVKARDAVMKQRTEDSVSYAMSAFPAVQAAAEAQRQNDTSENRQAFFAALSKAYDQLQLPAWDRKVFTADAMTTLSHTWDSMTPEQTVASLASLAHDTGDLFYNALNQLSKNGHEQEAFIADKVQTYPQLAMTMADALRGWRRAYGPDGEPSLRPQESQIFAEFTNMIGPEATRAQTPQNLKAMRELATGLYIERGGPVAVQDDPSQFDNALRYVVGGSDPSDTGIVDMSNGRASGTMTILPPGQNVQAFRKAIQNADSDFYTQNGNGIPVYQDGSPASPQDIENDGVFVQAGADTYIIQMGSDGSYLRTNTFDAEKQRFEPYAVKMDSEDVQALGALPAPTVTVPEAGFNLPGAMPHSRAREVFKGRLKALPEERQKELLRLYDETYTRELNKLQQGQ